MKKIFIGMTLVAGLAVADGFTETHQAEGSNAGSLSACPKCGFIPTNSVADACSVAVCSPVTNSTTVVAAPRDWKASVYGGYAAQSGNTVASSYSYGGEFSQNGKLYRGKLKLDGKYSKTEDQVTTSKAEASGEMRRMLNEHWFGYGVLSALHDDLKDLSYRIKTGPGMGYYFVDSKQLTADVSSGPLYILEKTSGSKNGYLAWRFAQGVDWKITDTFRWWISTEADVDTTDTSAYIISAKTGIENKINGNLSLFITVEDNYDSLPEDVDTIKKNDFEVSTGLRYTL